MSSYNRTYMVESYERERQHLNAKWPEADPVHQETLQINEYLSSVVSNSSYT
jgi:hypothetical protein